MTFVHSCENLTAFLQVADEVTATLLMDTTPISYCFYGDLGVGKTTFIRRMVQNLLHDDNITVPSPSFPLIIDYPLSNNGTLYHIDLYRLTTPEECVNVGISELMHQHLCLIEWPDRLGYMLPQRRVDIRINQGGDEKRHIRITRMP